MNIPPQKNAIAINEDGVLGIIDDQVATEDGIKWRGKGIQNGIFILPWFSTDPKVLCRGSDVFDTLAQQSLAIEVLSTALDHIWYAIYPNSSWEFPGQVSAHITMILREKDMVIERLQKDTHESEKSTGLTCGKKG